MFSRNNRIECPGRLANVCTTPVPMIVTCSARTFLYVNTPRDKQDGGSFLLKSPGRSLGKSLLFFAAVVFGQRIKKFCIRGHSMRQQLVVLADRGHVLSRAFRFSI